MRYKHSGTLLKELGIAFNCDSYMGGLLQPKEKPSSKEEVPSRSVRSLCWGSRGPQLKSQHVLLFKDSVCNLKNGVMVRVSKGCNRTATNRIESNSRLHQLSMLGYGET